MNEREGHPIDMVRLQGMIDALDQGQELPFTIDNPGMSISFMVDPMDDAFEILGVRIFTALRKRCEAIDEFGETDEAWIAWKAAGRGTVVYLYIEDKASRGVLVSTSPKVDLEYSMWVTDFDNRREGVVAGLRLVQTLEHALRRAQAFIPVPCPTYLGRTQRELDWLAKGGIDPGPGEVGTIKRRGRRAMARADFWEIIERVKTGPVELDEDRADAFRLTARALVDTLSDARARRVADRVIGMVSDDVWEDVRGWVVSLGKKTYQRVVRDPGHLEDLLRDLEVMDDLSTGELLLYGDLAVAR